ncbi:MAG: efflux RND transporter permease subunit [Geminicoccaceae bacterium]
MNALIATTFERTRAVLLILALLLVAGTVAYNSISKEAEPDIQIPLVYVAVPYEGISAYDAERLLARPVEAELQGLEGVKEIKSVSAQGRATITVEFDTGVDIDQAVSDVRDKVDRAKAELPAGADEPSVQEINLALFPVLVVTLSGDVPERELLRLARDLQDRIEGLRNVLEVEIAGEREELLEAIVEPLAVESYGLELESVVRAVDRNNQLVAAGALDAGGGRFNLELPGVFETWEDLMRLPLKVDGEAVVRLGDVASVRRTFKDPVGFARVDGRPALALEVSKRIGANIIDTIAEVRATVEEARQGWPPGVEVGYAQDKSDNVRSMLTDLQNNVLAAVLLVMIVVVAALGLRSALLVGFAVPGSFLTGILVLGLFGLTINMVVLFALILAVGMLVDGAIVVTELADRKMSEGMAKRDAYRLAAERMATPIMSATLTTLAAFLPLLFWPGIVGDFMKYLPITLLATLAASLLMALVFVPALGSIFGKATATDPATMKLLNASEGGDLRELGGVTGWYVRLLDRLLRRPALVALAAGLIAVGAWWAYGTYGRGVEFFPSVEPERGQLMVHARGDHSVRERDAPGIGGRAPHPGRRGHPPGLRPHGPQLSRQRHRRGRDRHPPARVRALADPPPGRGDLRRDRGAVDGLAGIHVEEREEEAGPPVGKPIQVEIGSNLPDRLPPVVAAIREHVDGMTGLREVTDSRAIPGIEWRMRVDREQAGRLGTDIATIGAHVQMVSNGVLLGTYRPDDADDEVDIRARFPVEYRNLGQLDRLIVNTAKGTMPVSSFVDLGAEPRTGDLTRIDGKRIYTVSADVAPGVLADDKVQELRAWLAAQDFDPAVSVVFKGEDEEQRGPGFLTKAFGVALFLIAIILVTQFNSFYQAGLILSAIVFSTVGVLLGLLVTNQPFGIVMSGIGVIALAGIVVNNNIVLIDTFNELRRRGLDVREAILRTGAQRLRPVMLTTITTILGLAPMVLKANVDLFARTITLGGPSADWWAQLATAVAGGLTFATLLTLVLTPCLLMLRQTTADGWQHLRHRLRNLRRRHTWPKAASGAPAGREP